jgi:hypothetical protein
MLSKANKLHAQPQGHHGRAFVLKYEHLAVQWTPYWLCIRAPVLPSPMEVCGDIQAFGCTVKPTKAFPRRALLAAQKG